MDNRRGQERTEVKERVDFAFTGEEGRKEAMVMDISGTGVRIAYGGKLLSADTILTIDSDSLNLSQHAQVAWSKNVGNNVSLTGLKFI
jgi:predicted RNA methylase